MNLPIAASTRPQPTELGRLLATFPEEYWIRVANHVSGPRPLTGICVIERNRGLRTAIQHWTGAPLALLPQFLGFPDTPARLASQLDLTGAIAANVPIYLLTADPSVPPGELASLVERTLFRSRLAA
jgi:hypothetical protein